ncbi:MAG TPA: hypothetical protein VGM73_07260, partial [Candidatus Didemnitutus sp.]
MITEISVALNSARAALEVAKNLKDATVDVAVNSKLIELQQHILDLQTKMFAVNDKVEELARIKDEMAAQLKKSQSWDEEKERYEPRQLAPGLLVYALKADRRVGEPDHYLCPHCFQSGKKRFLQKQNVSHRNYRCQEC